MTTNQQNNEEWEEQLLNFCDVLDTKDGHYLSEYAVKQFIRSTRQSAAQEAREEVLRELENMGYQVDDFRKKLQQLTTK